MLCVGCKIFGHGLELKLVTNIQHKKYGKYIVFTVFNMGMKCYSHIVQLTTYNLAIYCAALICINLIGILPSSFHVPKHFSLTLPTPDPSWNSSLYK